jgi:hypothetical protein
MKAGAGGKNGDVTHGGLVLSLKAEVILLQGKAKGRMKGCEKSEQGIVVMKFAQ